MPWDDRKLIERWQRGDPTAFEEIVRSWQTPVGRFLTRMIGCAEAAEDLSQEVFLRVYRSRESYSENGSFRYWIYQIALNVTRDAKRRERIRPKSIELHEGEAPGSPPAVELQRKELADAVNHAISELPGSLREVLVLRHYEEMSFADMSRLLKTPASTLKSRFATALARVGEWLRERGFLAKDDQP